MNSSKIMANSLDDSVFDGVAREESVQEIKSVSDEIKTLIGTEISSQLSALKNEIVASMPTSSGAVRKIQYGTFQAYTTSISLSGFSNASKMAAWVTGGGYIYLNSNNTVTDIIAVVSSIKTSNLTISYNGTYSSIKTNDTIFGYIVIEFY